MTYYTDLSQYTYHNGAFFREKTLNIGWLSADKAFPKSTPTPLLLDLIWCYCKISVAQMRGVHECEFCQKADSEEAERNGERLLLGTSEIRVFGSDGKIYAAPTLIYHYIEQHGYAPPSEFVDALTTSLPPPCPEYFARLDALGLEWGETLVLKGKTKSFRLDDL